MAARLLAISGMKNSGKTTLIERLLPILAEKGLRVAVIKHDGHSFTPDTPGTDSFRFFEAGACGTAVFDGEKFSMTRRCTQAQNILPGLFPEADLILLEGFKYSNYPKIEVVREGVTNLSVCNPQTLLAIVSALDIRLEVPTFHPDDLKGISGLILQFAYGGQLRESGAL